MSEPERIEPPFPRVLVYLLIFGLYLTLRGYHSRDGDQAYRLPLLLHRQDPALFAGDPFVRAFDAFNPHSGSLALLDLASRPFGLSAALFGLFALTFAATCLGVDRLARAAWPGRGPWVGVVAVGLLLTAKAGNIGTNHLFEAMLLDRLMALALGWLALAEMVARPDRGRWTAGPLIGLTGLIHPSLGIQLAATAGTAWVIWGAWSNVTGVRRRSVVVAVLMIALATLPGLIWATRQGGMLMEGLPVEEFRALAVMVQGPQHLLPSLWRIPQWLAWGGYLVVAMLAISTRNRKAAPAAVDLDSPPSQGGVRGGRPSTTRLIPARPPSNPPFSRGEAKFESHAISIIERSHQPAEALTRLSIILAVVLVGLFVSYLAIEIAGNLRATLFQPFRLATLARGLALILAADRVLLLWDRGDLTGRARATLLAVGLSGDWAMVVVTAVELVATAGAGRGGRLGERVAGGVALLVGLRFLIRHDTESGQVAILAALGVGFAYQMITRGRPCSVTPRRVRRLAALAWVVPIAAMVAPGVGSADSEVVRSLAGRCRFGATPTDDVERLATWCREHTPVDARFVGPPGPKTFRLWSRRSVAFNRAASPYHAAGLADWSSRFRDHVGFDGPLTAFVDAYQADRHGLERRYLELGDAGRAGLAIRQGATHVLAAAPNDPSGFAPGGPLELLKVEGRFAVYRVARPSVRSAARD